MSRITVPTVPDDADIYRSWRQLLTDLDTAAEGHRVLAGPEVGHGAVVEVPTGTLLLVVDERRTGWAETRLGRPYPVMDAAVALHLVHTDGTLQPLWQRRFAQAKSMFGAAARKMLDKHLTAHPQPADFEVEEITPGPGRPNIKAEPCVWCATTVAVRAGRLLGRGPDAVVEHRRGSCPAPGPVTAGTPCALCQAATAPQTAHYVQIRQAPGPGRWEVQHVGTCDQQPTREQYEQRRAALAGQRAAEQEQEAKRKAAAAQRKARADERKAARAAAAREAAAANARAVEEHGVISAVDVQTPYDKGVRGSGPTATRMRIVERALALGDGQSVTAWDVEVQGPQADEFADAPGRFYLLEDARAEYQRHSWTADLPAYPSTRTSAPLPATCPTPDVDHCGNCGTTVAIGGWMIASLGLSCPDCYDVMSGEPGRHDLRYHRQR
ncbi:hypothetical protein [Streptomyces sp. NPDC048603]|uniref:hypothetical protein n=1 Tax=Streptomyces sp. NPDC048603 TaxID=3365577 RepID=UPI00371041E9